MLVSTHDQRFRLLGPNFCLLLVIQTKGYGTIRLHLYISGLPEFFRELKEGPEEKTPGSFVPAFAKVLVGKIILIGLNVCDSQGNLTTQEQIHGTIIRVSVREGLVVKRSDGKPEYTLPPDTSAFSEARPGEYRLRSTGEVVVNPDYIASWTTTRPTEH